MEQYYYEGPAKNDTGFDTTNVKGKTAVVTGGSNGIGAGYVKHLVKAGAFVVFGDIDEKGGKDVEAESKGAAKFVRCDVTNWKDQVAMFKEAVASSPNKRVDVVVANAGITGYDEIFFQKPDLEEPEEPSLACLNINGKGALYTVKCALHYFHRQFAQNPEASKDQVLVLQGSLAGYLDLSGAVQYGFTKFGLRSVMRNLRRTEHVHGIRISYIGPWFIRTAILSPEATAQLDSLGVEFAHAEDCATALLKIVSDKSTSGRSFAILPRSMEPTGYVDMDFDDYKEGGWLRALNDAVNNVTHRSKPGEIV